MRTITTILAASALLTFGGCSKHECEDSAPAQEVGNAKIPNVFVFAQDNGVAVPNFSFSIHCGATTVTNGQGRLMFTSGGCPTVMEIAAGGACFQRNTYYWIKPPGTSNNRKFLRFNFTNAFDFTQLTSALVRYETNTYTWTVPNPTVGFEWMIYDTRKTLPACQGAIRQ
jgi:hypothetical protein